MKRAIVLTLVLGVVLVMAPFGEAAGPHPIARPLNGAFDLGVSSFAVERESLRISTDHLVLGVEHILDQQCDNGGFGWPHADCSVTYHSITGPILLGVLGTFNHTRDVVDLVGALNGGAFDLAYQFENGEARFPSFTPAFMRFLASASGNTTFSDHASTGFFGALDAGTYGPNDLDTAEWIAMVEAGRTGADVNLRSWEFHNLVETATILGQPGQDALFEQAILDGLNTLDNSDPAHVYSDLIGAAGAVYGLASARRLSFPAISASLHTGVDGIDNLEDLAAYLASLQNSDGSWNWHSNLASPTTGDEDVQTTAYALLAFLEVDVLTAADYQPATEAARDWILALQLSSGGFPEWPGGPENTEVEGEALTAVAAFDARLFVDGFEAGDTMLWDFIVP